ncbi:MAG: YlzJ-like family protein [Massiliimalia sp.]|jgi:hypothetical protein
MLYTIVDEQEIFLEDKNSKYFYKKVANGIVEGVQYKDSIVVQRVISTDLKDYLNPSLQPGQML